MGHAARKLDETSPHAAVAYLEEAFAETLACMSHDERVDLTRSILCRRGLDWSDAIEENVAVYMEDNVHSVKMGYRERPSGYGNPVDRRLERAKAKGEF